MNDLSMYATMNDLSMYATMNDLSLPFNLQNIVEEESKKVPR